MLPFNSKRGISGCKLELSNKRVSKYSSSVDYNRRLILQMDKQIFFDAYGVNVITSKF